MLGYQSGLPEALCPVRLERRGEAQGGEQCAGAGRPVYPGSLGLKSWKFLRPSPLGHQLCWLPPPGGIRDITQGKKNWAGPWKALFCFKVNEKEKNKIYSQPGHCLCGVCTFSTCQPGVSPGTPVSSHIPGICTLGELECLNCPRLSECGWPFDGRAPSRVGSHLVC